MSSRYRGFRSSPSPRRAALLAERAHGMRHAPTPAEARLWEALRGGRLGVAFRRQVVIGDAIADFAAPEVRLVVEVDGGYHAGRERADARRDEKLRRAGWRVVRVRVEDVHRDLEGVVAVVGAAVEVG